MSEGALISIAQFDSANGPKQRLGLSRCINEMNNEDILKFSIHELDLPVRPCNGLLQLGIVTIRDLISYSELDILKKSHVIGKKSISEIKKALEKFSLCLGMNISEVKNFKKKSSKKIYIIRIILNDGDDWFHRTAYTCEEKAKQQAAIEQTDDTTFAALVIPFEIKD